VKLEVGAFGSAAGIGVAAAFTICALFVALAPQPTAAFIGYLLHIDISGITRPVTWASYFAGVVSVGSCTTGKPSTFARQRARRASKKRLKSTLTGEGEAVAGLSARRWTGEREAATAIWASGRICAPGSSYSRKE
jgi:2TM family of unknown function (DUF5676)